MKPVKIKYPYIYIVRYIPQKYSIVSDEDRKSRELVYAFKDGHCPVEYMERIVTIIKKVTANHPETWVVAFVPASEYKRHIERFISLRDYIEDNISITVHLEALMYDLQRKPVHKSSYRYTVNSVVNETAFKDKNVILIDDVITTGKSFQQAGNILRRIGAKRIYGIIFAKTFYPEEK